MLDQKEQLLILIKNYNFKINSINKFSREYNVCSTTIRKYLKELNIEYNNKKIYNHNRNENGQFTFKNKTFSNTNNKKCDYENVQRKINQKLYIKNDLTPEETVEKLLSSLKKK